MNITGAYHYSKVVLILVMLGMTTPISVFAQNFNPFPACKTRLAPRVPWYSSWLLTPQTLDREQRFAARDLTMLIQEKMETYLGDERKRFQEISGCLNEIGEDWKDDLSNRCKALPNYPIYHQLIYSGIPVAYRAMRVNLALAFPPGKTIGHVQHLWDFNDQVNIDLKTPPTWPLVGEREPLWQGHDPSQEDELSLAKKEFYSDWKNLIQKHIAMLAIEVDHLKDNPALDLVLLEKRGLMDQLQKSLGAPTLERMAFMAGSFADRNWQSTLIQEWALIRTEKIANFMAVVNIVRPLAALTSAVPTPKDLATVFDQMSLENSKSSQEIANDHAQLQSGQLDSSAEQGILEKYFAHIEFLNQVLKDNPSQCDLAMVLLENNGVSKTTGMIGNFILYGTFGILAAPELATASFLGLNTKWIHDANGETAKMRRDMLSTFGPEGQLVAATDVYSKAHEARMLYLNYPLFLIGGASSKGMLRIMSAVRVPVRELATNVRVLRAVNIPGMENSPFKFFQFVDRDGNAGVAAVQ